MRRLLLLYAIGILLIGLGAGVYLFGPRLLLTEAYWLIPAHCKRHTPYAVWSAAYEFPGKYMMCYGAWHNIAQAVAPSCIPVDGEVNRCHWAVTTVCNWIYDERS